MTQKDEDVLNAVTTYQVPGPIAQSFHDSNAAVRILRGPLGSGKTTSAILETLKIACRQQPSRDGIRRTRFLCIRSTFPELKSTVIESFKQWIPTSLGKWNHQSPISFRIQAGTLDVEWWFLALDNEADVKKVLSLEVTCAWFSEIGANGGIPKGIFEAVTGRIGRYPSMGAGLTGCDKGPTFHGIIAETNSGYTTDDWLGALEIDPPESWSFHVQPGGLEEGAENKEHLPHRYYEQLLEGKDKDWIDVYVNNKLGRVMYGKTVYPTFKYTTHVKEVEPVVGQKVLAGFDPGLAGAAIVLGQLTPHGQWRIFDEYTSEELGIRQFGEHFRMWFQRTYPMLKLEGWADPAATARSRLDSSITGLKIINDTTGFVWRPAPVPNNEINIRIEAVRGALNRLVLGEPGFVIDPKCKTLVAGFASGYFYKQVRSSASGADVYQDKPEKNKYSHAHDALQYLMCGGREHFMVIGEKFNKKSVLEMPSKIDLEAYQPNW